VRPPDEAGLLASAVRGVKTTGWGKGGGTRPNIQTRWEAKDIVGRKGKLGYTGQCLWKMGKTGERGQGKEDGGNEKVVHLKVLFGERSYA